MIYHPKSEAVPPCLAIEEAKADGTYNCGNVLELIQNDFKNKCYICEFKNPPTINTEHFIPHKGNKGLKFDWNNLFYVCAHCNNVKLAKLEFDDILNCTLVEDIDKKIQYQINPLPKEKAVITALEDTPTVNNTVELLRLVYNGSTTLKKLESANIRSFLLQDIRAFNNLLFEYVDDRFNEIEREEIKQRIIRELRPASNFTAFKRWILRGNGYFNEIFAEHMN